MTTTTPQAEIGLIGLAVMGRNLALNINDHGYKVAVYNRTTSEVDEFLAGDAAGTQLIGTHSVEELTAQLIRPRRVILMIKAGPAVDAVIEQLLPYLDPGDIIMDGGNSHYEDTIRRTEYLEGQGLLFVGTGISGGEEGARYGPSIMPGGSPAAWPYIKHIFQDIAAKAADGEPCCDWVGPDGAGHFVKMVHNGIEYGDMQLIAEAYHLLKVLLGMSNEEMSAVFRQWNTGRLNSYLVEITGDILAYKNEEGQAVIDLILDAAGQKGTGKWTVVNALEQGVPLTLIGEAVFARFLSALKLERTIAAGVLSGPEAKFSSDREAMVSDIGQALYAAKLVSYTQGYQLFRAASMTHNWNLDYGSIARMWRAGCIIRSAFLGEISEAYAQNPTLSNLLLDDYFRAQMDETQGGWRRTIAHAVTAGIPVPALSSALAFYDGYRQEWLPANMIQAQRDYFGAHTYERLDRPRGEFFHTNWTGEGGVVTAGSYQA